MRAGLVGNMINKELVKLRFEKNLRTYDNSAVVQRKMAKILAEKIASLCGTSFSKIFEFGVGTGFLTRDIIEKIDFDEYCANDIMEESGDYVKKIIKNAKFLQGDIEKIEPGGKYGLIISNAVMQWVLDFDDVILKMKNHLNEGGYFAFTTFGEKNYSEIKETTGLALNYLKSETLRQKCEKYFDILYLEEEIETLYFDSPLDVLRHIKSSGTNGLKPLKWTFSKLKSFEHFYFENFRENNKVKLTYNPIFVVLRAKM